MTDLIPLDELAVRDRATGLLVLRGRSYRQIPIDAQVRDLRRGLRGVVIPTRLDEDLEPWRDEMVSVQWLDSDGQRLRVETVSRAGFPYELIGSAEAENC